MMLLYVRHFVRQDFVQFIFLHCRRVHENPPEERERSGRVIQTFYADTVYLFFRHTYNEAIQTECLNHKPDEQYHYPGKIQIAYPFRQHEHTAPGFCYFTPYHNLRQHRRVIKVSEHNHAVTAFQPFTYVDKRQDEWQYKRHYQDKSSGTKEGIPRAYQFIERVKQD